MCSVLGSKGLWGWEKCLSPPARIYILLLGPNCFVLKHKALSLIENRSEPKQPSHSPFPWVQLHPQ